MNILILGGNGFVGSHLTDSLLARGYSVRSLDKNPEKYREPLKEVDYYLGDFTDRSFLANALEGIDCVFHALSTTVPATSNSNPEFDIKTNLNGTIGLLDEMAKTKIRRIVFLSSGGTVYGNTEVDPIPESHPLNPSSSYAIVKAAIEYYLGLYQQMHGLQPIILRVSNLYGARYGHIGVQGIITTSLHNILNNAVLKVWGDGTAVRDYLYIDDFIALCMAVLESQETGVFNVGAGKGHSIKDILGIISKMLGKNLDVIFEQNRTAEIKKVVLDISKVEKIFGWEPKIPLEEGIRRVWEWMKKS